jgi:hypothetical protein
MPYKYAVLNIIFIILRPVKFLNSENSHFQINA